ncbi:MULTISPECIES: hypothetical protein [unclassified Calothrix]|uniref:hypothetical protein n=1 Tax=unclassified Calothrix TaxID=2619626 RepID=UPI0018EF64F5|nr:MULTISPECIES: hypothetical protein [unclassified Calothrix]
MTALNLNRIRFSNNADVVNQNRAIYNPRFAYVNTLNGDDRIIGTSSISADFGLGVYVELETGKSKGRSLEVPNAKAAISTYGIKNEGVIHTNDGNDVVRGRAIANIGVLAETVSQAIAIAEKRDATAIASAFASLNVNANVNGIDNSWGGIYTGKGDDSVSGDTEGSISAVAIATVDATSIVEVICKTPASDTLTAFAQAVATSLATGSITATGIRNTSGTIFTGKGDDTLSASATTSTAGLSATYSSAFANATSDNQALALAVAQASTEVNDKAIAIDNTRGWIATGRGDDIIEATAKAYQTAIAIDNNRGSIHTGLGNDKIIAKATGDNSYGIFGGTIDTGRGNDTLIASSLGGGVQINLGEGDDFLQGFGQAIIDGGRGFDTISFDAYNIGNFEISFGIYNRQNSVIFQLDGISAIATGFEQFNFANGSYSYNDLISHNRANT